MGERGGGQTQAAPNRFLRSRLSTHGVSGPPPRRGLSYQPFVPAPITICWGGSGGSWCTNWPREASGPRSLRTSGKDGGAGGAWQGPNGAKGLGTHWYPATENCCAPQASDTSGRRLPNAEWEASVTPAPAEWKVSATPAPHRVWGRLQAPPHAECGDICDPLPHAECGGVCGPRPRQSGKRL